MNKEKPKKEADKYARDDLDETNKFLKKCKREIAFCEIKPVKTSKEGELENQVLFRKKKICQICFSNVAYFSQYRFGADGKTIFKPTNQSELDEAYEWTVQRIQSIEDALDAKPVKKSPIKKPTKTESVEDLEKRIEKLSPKSNALHVSEITDDILSWVESTDYKFVDDGHTLLVRTA